MSWIVDFTERIALAMGYSVCHQMPERSFFVGGRQLPVCARDTGIFMGFALTVLLSAALLKKNSFQSVRIRLLLSLLILPALLDAATSYLHLRDTNNATRVITGVLAGVALAFIAWSYYPDWLELGKNERVSDTKRGKLKVLFALLIPLFLIPFVTKYPSVSFLVWTFMLIAAILLTLLFLNSELVLLLSTNWLKKEKAVRPGAVIVISLFMTILELGVSNRLHYLVERILV